MIDPASIRITFHAYTRYAERRGYDLDRTDWQAVDTAMRDLLGRVAHKNPPLRVQGGRSCRLFEVGELVFVVSADGGTLITVYPRKRRQPRKARGRRRDRFNQHDEFDELAYT
jgi:hypothetical protein